MTELEVPPNCHLPRAPLAMPKQVLERRHDLFAALRWALFRTPLRS